MSRPKRERSVRCLPEVTHFEPRGVSAGAADAVELSLDELEALRLADLQGRAQADAAERMGVSRATFGRVVASARCKVASALVQGRAIHEELGACRSIAVVSEIAHLLGEDWIIDAGGVDLHAHLPQIGAAGDRRHRSAGERPRDG
ncbi:MAG: hypothetical protein CVV17_00105, partial [Gammaproteobacteria bacterium HGW-Gammaproteobacteria-7]